MTTFREWFNKFEDATGERPTEIVLGWASGWGSYNKERWPEWDHWGQVTRLTDVPSDLLDCEFNDGYGGNETPNLCGWSDSWVVFSDNYDGSEGIQWVPRHPRDHEPLRPGGG